MCGWDVTHILSFPTHPETSLVSSSLIFAKYSMQGFLSVLESCRIFSFSRSRKSFARKRSLKLLEHSSYYVCSICYSSLADAFLSLYSNATVAAVFVLMINCVHSWYNCLLCMFKPNLCRRACNNRAVLHYFDRT